jgi:argininosuccinate lyase
MSTRRRAKAGTKGSRPQAGKRRSGPKNGSGPQPDAGASGGKLWGGRFEGGLDPFFERFNRSLPFDRRLVDEDLVGSIAWAHALGAAGVLTAAEVRELARALEDLRSECRTDPRALEQSIARGIDEDVHSFVERLLTERVGVLGKKLHTGRSRNDQVATDLKLWLRSAADELDRALVGLMTALTDLAHRTADLPVPGYTHLQRAQPITAGHHALAYVEMLARDRERLADLRRRADTCPLGCGALAGTAFPIDRKELARALGFASATRNSLDTVSDRDHVAELLFAQSLMLVHLSRLAEDWIFQGTYEARFVRFADAVATGSSLMPQKKNPDALELIRGKCGRVVGHLQSLLVTLKALPLAYDKDLQEDKEGLFDAFDTTVACLRVMTTVVETIEYDAERCRDAASRGFLNATDLADLLVAEGVPFRDAHDRVGLAVRTAIQQGVELEDLPPPVVAELLPELRRLPRGLTHELGVDQVVARRNALGGTAPARVSAEAKRWSKALGRALPGAAGGAR